MSPKDTLFFAEMYTLVKKMEETIDEFEMKDRVLATIVVGVLDLEAIEYGDEEAEMKTMYSFNLQNRAELEAVKDVMDNAYLLERSSSARSRRTAWHTTLVCELVAEKYRLFWKMTIIFINLARKDTLYISRTMRVRFYGSASMGCLACWNLI